MKTILRWLVSAGVLLGAGWVGQAQPVTPPVATTSYSRGLLTKTNAEDARNWLGLSGTNGAVSSTNLSVYGTLTVSGNTNIVANGSNGLITAAAVRILTNYPVASNSLVWSDWVKAWVSEATTGQNMVTNNASGVALVTPSFHPSARIESDALGSQGVTLGTVDTGTGSRFTISDTYTSGTEYLRADDAGISSAVPFIGNANGLTNFSHEALAAAGVVTNNGGNYTLSGTMGGPSASFGTYNGNGSGLTSLPADQVIGNLTSVSNITASGLLTVETTNGTVRMEAGSVAPSFTLGSSSNRIIGGTGSAVIMGGGSGSYPNIITGTNSRYTLIGGGYDNMLDGIANVIVSSAHSTNRGTHNLIAGGSYALNDTNVDYGSIVGGTQNTLTGTSDGAVVLGGEGGLITNGAYAAIVGGFSNRISADYGVVAGRFGHVSAAGAMLFNADSTPTTNSVAGSLMLAGLGGVTLNVRSGAAGLELAGANNFPIKLTPLSDTTAKLQFDIGSPHSASSGSSPLVDFFANTTSSGSPALRVHRATGSASVNTSLGGNGNSYLNALAGSVAIGKTTPATMLDVAGTVTATNFVGVGYSCKSNALPTAATLYGLTGGAGSGIWSYTNALLGYVVDGATNVTWKVLVP